MSVNNPHQQLVEPAASLVTSIEQYTKVITSIKIHAYSTKPLFKKSDKNVYSHQKKHLSCNFCCKIKL